MIDLSPQATEEEAAAAAERWLHENLPPSWLKAVLDGDREAVAAHRADAEAMRAWFALLGDSGLATPSWPREHGGLGLSADAAGAVSDVLLRYSADHDAPAFIGRGLTAPTILQHGTEEQKRRHLPGIRRGEVQWCQLFSEPGAGSDLAALATRAERQEDGTWRVNGQKVWNSYAHFADWGILMARTDPTLPKHRGISYFLVDMRTPGVQPRPLRQMNGDAEFNEVFLDDVVLPEDALLGGLNNGWAVGISTLMQERNGLSGRPGVGEGKAEELARLAARTGTWADPLLRDRLLSFLVEERVLQMTTLRAFAEAGTGPVGAEGSIRKLVSSALQEQAGVLAAEADPVGVLGWPQGGGQPTSAYDFLTMKQTAIAGGTSEIQRNIIAERLLGLPKDPDPEKDVPFDQRSRG
ncbi:acyl-CoA dehydrogenase family protein [Blastococcus sp. SYSU D00669]